MKLFNFNKTIFKYSTNNLYSGSIMLMIFVYCILINSELPKNFVIFFNNILFQTFLLILIIVITYFNKNLGIYILILYGLTFTYTTYNYYNFLKEETFLGLENIDNNNVDEGNNLYKKNKDKINTYIKSLINNVCDTVGIEYSDTILKKLNMDKS